LRRLSDFLSAEELQPDARKVIERPFLDPGAEVLSIKGGDFAWSKDAIQPVLEDINFSVKKGELVGVLGQVGCGKVITSLSEILDFIPDHR
jgi:ABC-type bacteriocin/lantibiotic exporter with double-glycine peptidase domain